MTFAGVVDEAAQRFGIPAAWICAVIRAESVGDQLATSARGAMGLMQIMPETWVDLRRRYHLGVNPFDPHDKIMAGAAYLRELRDQYGIPGFLAAYNVGPARWEDHLATGRPLPIETRAYLLGVVPMVGGDVGEDTTILASVPRSWTEASLFPARLSAPPNAKATRSDQQPARRSDAAVRHDWIALEPQSARLFVTFSSRARSR